MNPITAATIASLNKRRIDSDDHRSEEAARLRREAERARMLRSQRAARRESDAASRLTEAMVRAAERNNTLSQPLPRPLAILTTSVVEAEANAEAQTQTQIQTEAKAQAQAEAEAMRSAEAGSDAAYRVEPALAGPVTAGLVASRGGNQEHDGLHAVLHGLRQRIANGGDSLMRDCAPALAALEQGLAASEQLGLEHVGEDGALLRELLEFLHGYAEGMSRRDPASADFLQQIERIEARLHVIAHDPLTAGSAVAAYGPGSRAAEGGGRVSTRERSRVFAPKKSDCADDDSEATTDPSSAAAAQAAAMVVGSAGPGRVSGIDDASLDKDQRKRREESLPLVVIRSI